ncbi:MAG: homoserine dehydrogenase [Acidimicrobiia bacterium]|nr:homoserine dehydrogenase [Acidimicrobiia bacterium]
MAVGIGILGGGNVGGSLARKLLTDREVIATKAGLDLELIGVSVRDMGRDREFPSEYATDRPEELINRPEVRLVVETMGGIEPANSLILSALDSGKPVVTANKELVAARGPELFERAANKGVSLLYEAAVGGGIPIIRPLSESLAGERLTRVTGIVNGTTNFILSTMEGSDASYDEVLRQAQQLGYAEPDPSADVDGSDAAAKAAILAGLAFGSWVGSERVFKEGIETISKADVENAARLGYVIKLLGLADTVHGGVSVRVHPTLVPNDHPLASIRGAQNAIFVEGPAIGELMFTGPGAGGAPTATAVLGDVLTAARELLADTQVSPRIRFGGASVVDFEDVSNSWYIRLEVSDRPGVLAAIASVFGDHDVSIRSVWQEGLGDQATLLLITHEGREGDHSAAVSAVDELPAVRQVAATIRVIT